MIPNNSITNMYVKIIGENSLLSIAQNNLLNNLERISKFRTYTFLSNNAQTNTGVSRNFDFERHYSWEDTIIDCRNNPTLINSEFLKDFDEIIAENSRFMRFKEDLEQKMGSFVNVEPFYNILLGEDNMRYNIKQSTKIEDFDIIRIGIKLFAKDDETFKQGLENLDNFENPFKICKPLGSVVKFMQA